MTWVWDREVLHILGAIPVAALIRFGPLYLRRIPLRLSLAGFRIALGLVFLLAVSFFEFLNIASAPETYWKSFVDVSTWGLATVFWYWFIRRLK